MTNDSGNWRYIEIDGEQIPVNEEVYRAYKRPLWAEHKRKEREKRCRGENGFRCTNDCRTCGKTREGSVLSIDKFSAEGYEISDPLDVPELVADKLLLEQLAAALQNLEPDEQSLVNALFYKGRTERDYASKIGVSHQAVGKRKQRVIEKLRGLLKIEK